MRRMVGEKGGSRTEVLIASTWMVRWAENEDLETKSG